MNSSSHPLLAFLQGSEFDWSAVTAEQSAACLADKPRLVAELTLLLQSGGYRQRSCTLPALMPICAACKKIKDDKGYWNQIEVYVQARTPCEFTHSFCPDCMRRLYPEVFEERIRR